MKSITLTALFVSLCTLPASQSTFAANVSVFNHSFEQADASNGVASLEGWLLRPDTGIFVETGLRNGAFDGNQHATFHQVGFIYQDLGIAWQPNAVYEVKLAAAHRGGFGHGRVEFGLWDSGDIGRDMADAGFIDVQELWQGPGNPNTILNTFVEPDDPRLNVGVLDRAAEYKFQTSSTVPTGNAVAFARFFSGGGRAHIDNFRVTVIPEPATSMLAITSGLGLVLFRRKRG